MWSKNDVLILPQLHILCRSAVKVCLKRQITVHVSPVSRAVDFMETRKTCHRVVQSGQFLTLESFAIKTVSARLRRR